MFFALARSDGVVDDFGYLAAGGVVAPAECAVGVAGEDCVAVGGFYIGKEGVAGGHIREGGCGGGYELPAASHGNYLAQLAACDGVVWAECAVGVAGDDAVSVGCFYVGVE